MRHGQLKPGPPRAFGQVVIIGEPELRLWLHEKK
jgi:hypothetical protein